MDGLRVPGLEVRVVQRCGSTNEELMREGKSGVLLAALEQTAGRGRRGRRWYSGGVTFSVSAHVGRPARELAGLSLVAGVAAARALGAQLKWPNDLVLDGAKLGGILVETRGNFAVIGIGINCRRDPALERRVRRAVAFIDMEPAPIIAGVASELLAALAVFEREGLEPLRAEWERRHAHDGARVRVRLADGRVLTGIARGLDADGGLRLDTRGGVRAVRSGQVLSARPA
ncbi:MAG TPA: biotin--[acetyl-CoA-carboxylase] ligase [Burkholderiales bacterium]|nr:biotin--[acetyl-CoA-carboxylase] ligase [Burkholderiales bacterium]